MAYDGVVLALGSTLGEGPLLHALSFGRFALHATLVPLWALAAGELAREAGGWLTRARWLRPGLLTLAVALVAFEVRGLADLELAPTPFGGTLRYTRATPGGPPVGALATLGVVLVLAPWISRRVLAAGLCLLVLAGAPMSRVGPLPGNLGELLLAAALVEAALWPRGVGAPGPPAESRGEAPAPEG